MNFIRKTALVVGLLLLSMNTISGVGNKIENYKQLWENVTAAENDRLPKTALESVDQIYKKALRESNHQQIIKALIYKLKYIAETDENSDLLFFEQLENEINKAGFPVKNILQSLRAETYWQYFQAHRWRFYDRTETSDYDHKDIRTWDLKKILKETIKNYQLSLSNKEDLKKVPIDDFEEILDNGNTRALRPTVYDFLAHRAIDFFANDESQLIQPAYQFQIDDNSYFSKADKFIEIAISTADTLSLKFHALIYLQDLVAFHLNDTLRDALLDVDLRRLKFVYQNAVTKEKIGKYETSLMELVMKYNNSPLVAEVFFPIAQLHSDLSSKYNSQESDDYKWYKKKAHDICKKVLEQYPGTPGASNCLQLKTNLENKNISLQMEKVNLPDEPILGLCQFRNIDKVYYRIYKTDYLEIKNKLHYDSNSILDLFRSRKYLKSGEIILPDDGDLNPHSTEIKIPELPLGQYVFILSYNRDFNDELNCVTYNIIEVSNISYIHRKIDSETLEFYLINRKNGEPIPDVAVTAWTNNYNDTERRYQLKKGIEFQTDKKGFLNIDLPIKGMDDERYFFLQFSKGDDTLFLDQNYSNYPYYNEEHSYLRTFFFTDRAIYRPGQTVYFKGIVLETDGKDNQIKTGYRTRVELIDVNYQKVAELDLITNEFGTISGSFVIPQGVLTGNFYISNNLGEHHFSVEEYKRPTFEVNFDPVTESYALGDDVSVSGKAKAYAGFNIDNAELTYRVVRTVSYPRWWYFYRRSYYNDTMEIVNGVSKTDNEGNFEINFQAIPDLKIPKEDDPAFTYQIFVDVTDINGETRSAQEYVRVGYTMLRLEFSIPDKVNQEQEEFNYAISSLNLNGQYEPAAGTIKIYKLDSTDKIFRQKLWGDPDKRKFTREEYYSEFPHDQYDSELDYYKWEKELMVWEDVFDTEVDKIVNLKKIPQLVWEQGV